MRLQVVPLPKKMDLKGKKRALGGKMMSFEYTGLQLWIYHETKHQVGWKILGPAAPQCSHGTENFRWNESPVDILIQLYLAKYDFVLLRRKYLVESAVRFWNPVSFISKSVWFYFSPSRVMP